MPPQRPEPIEPVADRVAPGNPRYSWVSSVAQSTAVVLIFAGIFCVSGPQEGMLGLTVFGTGLLLFAFPTRISIPSRLVLLTAIFLGSCALVFLPASWLPRPEWRAYLEDSLQLPLGPFVSPQPWITLQWLGVLGCALALALFLLAHPVSSRTQLNLATLIALLAGLFAAVSMFLKEELWTYPFALQAPFGLFPNKNHTANLLAVGCVLAMGAILQSFRERRWLRIPFLVTALGTAAWALTEYSDSRAGILLLAAGALAWFAGLGRRHLTRPVLISGVALIVMAGVIFLTSQSASRKRVGELIEKSVSAEPGGEAGTQAISDGDPPLDFRVVIMRDALAMIRANPLTGVGLGNFEAVFARYRNHSLTMARVLHPESDWVMLAAEAGIPALLLALFSIGTLWRLSRPSSRHPAWPLRWAFVVAMLCFALHGMMDVPVHRIALGWLAVFVGCQALRLPLAADRPSLLQRIVFPVAGLAIMGLAVPMIRSEWFAGSPTPAFASAKAREKAMAIFTDELSIPNAPARTEAALLPVEAALPIAPLDPRLYYHHGYLLIHLEGTDEQIDRAFAIRRFLNPEWVKGAIDQGLCWSAIDPDRAVAEYESALQMAARSRPSKYGSTTRDGVYREIVRISARNPALYAKLLPLAGSDVSQRLIWIENADKESAGREIRKLLIEQGTLADDQTRQLLWTWYRKSDPEEVIAWIEKNPISASAAWPVIATHLAKTKRYEEACRRAEKALSLTFSLPPVESLPELAVLRDRHEKNPQDPLVALDLARRYSAQGNPVSAERILRELKADPAAMTPDTLRSFAAFAASSGDWPAAWKYLSGYIKSQHPQLLP